MNTQDYIVSRSIPVPESGCWIWEGSSSAGYGDCTFNGRHVKAHILSYEAFNGGRPAGKLICHKCDVRACVNPAHLYAGTYSENRYDATRRNPLARPRSRKSGLTYRPYPTAARIAKMKLPPEKREELRAARKAGETYRALAKRFGLGYGATYRICQ